MKEVDRDDLPPEQRAELNSAFGEDSTVIELEEEDFPEPVETEYPMKDLFEVGVGFSYETLGGRIISGVVTEVKDYGLEFDPDQKVGGWVSFSAFGGERGQQLELLTVNGKEVDPVYGEVEV
jgi:hypothetical protein